MRKIIMAIAVAAVLSACNAADAAAIRYTVGGWGAVNFPAPITPPATAPHVVDGQGYPGDSLAMLEYTGTFDLVPGTSVQKINSLQWNINWTYGGTATDPSQSAWSVLNFSVPATRTISFNGVAAGSVNQNANLQVDWDSDRASLSTGATSTFYVDGFKIDVTPLGLSEVPGYTLGPQDSRDVMARFDVAAVPEPSSISALVAGAAALLIFRRKKAS